MILIHHYSMLSFSYSLTSPDSLFLTFIKLSGNGSWTFMNHQLIEGVFNICDALNSRVFDHLITGEFLLLHLSDSLSHCPMKVLSIT